jgi:serine/threonine protein kinase
MGVEVSGASICPSCGKTLPPGAKFCGYDGTILDAPAPSVTKRTAVEANNKTCSKCQAVYPSYAQFCTVDGASLATVYVPDLAEPNDWAPLTELIGQTVGGKYHLDHFLGQGGMAVVYKATHINIERPVVIKIMQAHLLSNERAIKRFEQECKLTARINHPNVVSVFDVGFIKGNQPYLVMEYIKGESLRDRLDREARLSPLLVATILSQMCAGLQEAHGLDIIHRDLKPENILLQEKTDRPDWVKLVDFGIAHLVAGTQRYTKTGNVVGTAEYMSPEQLRDTPIDTRCDIYALGVVAFEMLAGRVPFTADSAEAVLLKQLLDAPDPPSKYAPKIKAGGMFDHIVLKALEKSADNRYQTVAEMRADLALAYNEAASVL